MKKSMNLVKLSNTTFAVNPNLQNYSDRWIIRHRSDPLPNGWPRWSLPTHRNSPLSHSQGVLMILAPALWVTKPVEMVSSPV